MNGFQSPDIPAIYCYLFVLFVGTVVARARVNTFLGRYPDRWAFSATWSLFAAYCLLPLLLFWFLDYTAVIHDTTLFAALAVAVLYPQIFAGGVDGIAMPGQTAALWKPFEAWTKVVDERIRTRNKTYIDRFEEQLRSNIASRQQAEDELETLARERSQNLTQLESDLAPLRLAVQQNQPGASRRFVDRVWRELRLAEPENYGYLLRQRGLIGWGTYWWWLAKGRAKLVSWTVLFVALVLGVWAGIEILGLTTDHPERVVFYYRWRFEKEGVTDRDRFRSRMYLARVIHDHPERAKDILPRLAEDLRFKNVSSDQVKRTLDLVRESHSPDVDEASIGPLIEDLREDNIDLRRHVQELLLTLQEQDYAARPVDEILKTWMPKENETPADIENIIKAWRAWKNAPPKPSNPVQASIVNTGKAELPGLMFDFNKATIKPESEPVLQQAAQALKDDPAWKLEIQGYTDNVGSDQYNLQLSQRRAEAVRLALEPRPGVGQGRLVAKGFGATHFKASNDTEQGRAQNRRVQLVKIGP